MGKCLLKALIKKKKRVLRQQRVTFNDNCTFVGCVCFSLSHHGCMLQRALQTSVYILLLQTVTSVKNIWIRSTGNLHYCCWSFGSLLRTQNLKHKTKCI